MAIDNSDNIPHYDAAQALAMAHDIPAVRDHVVHKILESFADGGELAALLDVSCYRSDPAGIRALLHATVGYAQQGGMPALELLCMKLGTALKSGEFGIAEEVGRDLPATIESTRAAVTAEFSVQSGT